MSEMKEPNAYEKTLLKKAEKLESEMKLMDLYPTGRGVLITFEVNPFVKRETESGIYLSHGMAYSQETGRSENQTQNIGYGKVLEVGPDCETVKKGGYVMFPLQAATPFPFYDTELGIIHTEYNIIVAVNKSEEKDE